MFLLPGLVVTAYVTGCLDDVLPGPAREAAVLYLRNHQQSDGGWGTHIESPSTMFGTVLSYVMLRLLGVGADEEVAVAGRAFVQAHGGALYTSSWAKFWLAVLGVYDWDGVNSIPVEMWLLPDWFPFHPGRLWCHCRMVRSSPPLPCPPTHPHHSRGHLIAGLPADGVHLLPAVLAPR